MRALRLLAMPLLASIGIAPAVAQSSVAQSAQPQAHVPLVMPSPFARQPLPGDHRFSFDPGGGISLFAPKPRGTGFSQTLPSLHLRRYDQFSSWPDSNALRSLGPLRTQRTVVVAHNDVCYTIREYTFTRDHPDSDATSMKDYSACRPASNFHLKGAAPASPR
jgi:hypothetical protein